VAVILRAAFALRPTRSAISELRSELTPEEMEVFIERLKGRPGGSFAGNKTKARQALLNIIDRETARLAALAERRRRAAALSAQVTAARLEFDETDEGERLHRYEHAGDRALVRALNAFYKARREAKDLPPAASAEPVVLASEPELARATEPELVHDPEPELAHDSEPELTAAPGPECDLETLIEEEPDAADPNEVDATGYDGVFGDDETTDHGNRMHDDLWYPDDVDVDHDLRADYDTDEPVQLRDDDYVVDDKPNDSDDPFYPTSPANPRDPSDPTDPRDPSDRAMPSWIARGGIEKQPAPAGEQNPQLEPTARGQENLQNEPTARGQVNSQIELWFEFA
jgi:hypothetical protein